MEKNNSFPLAIRLSQIVTGIVALFFILYIGQDILIPLTFALVIAILLNPFVNYLQNKKVNRVISIIIAVVIAFLLLAGLFYFIGSQIVNFSDAIPAMKQKLNILFSDTVTWVSQSLNISTTKINEWLLKQKTAGLSNSTAVIGQTLSAISGVFIMLFLLPVYIFMFLFYKPLLLDFIAQLFPVTKHKTVAEVLNETKSLIQNYLVGLMIEAAIVAALNSLGLFMLGIDYALLLGVIGALLNIIPYIGGIIAISLPMIIAIATKEPMYAVYVLFVYMAVQLIDNNFIVPRIVASKVKVNALVSIVVVLIGGALWGVPGMFLSLPLTAIIKVIFDRIEQLKPFGFLIGDNMPHISKGILNFRKAKK